jgi:hypothetical protein
LKKQIITVFELKIMVGYTNVSSRDMLDHLFETDGNITAVDLEINFEHMRQAWDPQHPVESFFKHIQDWADYYEAVGVLIGHPQQINVYVKIFLTGHFMRACHRWNEKDVINKTWTQFKSQVAAGHGQHKQMQVRSTSISCFHSTNADVGPTEDQMAEATIGALANLSTSTALD